MLEAVGIAQVTLNRVDQSDIASVRPIGADRTIGDALFVSIMGFSIGNRLLVGGGARFVSSVAFHGA